MTSFSLPKTRHPPDVVFLMIDIPLRFGRWLLETSMLCIVGVMILGAFRGGWPFVLFFGDADTWRWTNHLPAIGWWLGLAIGTLRLYSTLKKPMFTPVDDDQDSNASDDIGTSTEDEGNLVDISIRQRFRSSAKGSLIGLLVGSVLGLMLAVSGCVVATAGLLSPLAPDSWTQSFDVNRVDENDRPGIRRPGHWQVDHNSGIHASASFWHPVYGRIILVSWASCALLGVSVCSYLGWYDVE